MNMDVNDLRIGVTLASLALFVALVLHTWSRRRRGEHEAAALLPFAEDELPPAGKGEQA
jgi:cytochrome c oxidase cbb3-type subunit 4